MTDRTMLVVDDDAPVLEMFEQVFKRAGFTVITADSGENALDIVGNQNIQVMFLDLNLPGINGVELCKEIRKVNPDAFIYAVTGYSSIFEHAKCLEAGFNNYFKKPIDIHLLVKTAKEAFEHMEKDFEDDL